MCAGRPPKYSNNKQLAAKIEEYFVDADKRKAPYTIPSLAYFLGFDNRHAPAELARTKPEFSATIRRATTRIEAQRAEALVQPDNHNANGMKFDLQNNFNWVDERKQDINLGGQANNPLEFKVTFVKPE